MSGAEQEMHLAQLNLARVRYALDDPRMAEATERLEYLNTHGSSDRAFGWESLPDQQARRQARCVLAAE